MSTGGPPLRPGALRPPGGPGAPSTAGAAATHQPTALGVLLHFVLFSVCIFVVLLSFRRFGFWIALFIFIMLVKMGCMRFPLVLWSVVVGGAALDHHSESLRRADTMPAPITTKHGTEAHLDTLSYGMSCMQGWRRSMEDAHLVEPNLKKIALDDGYNAEELATAAKARSFFAVFDGHSGAGTANFCGANLSRFLMQSEAFRHGRLAEALADAYLSIDKFLRTNPPQRDDRSGCTAVSLLLTETEVYCANAGDSRCILCRDGRAIPLSTDHKPHLPLEKRRIMRAKGFVFNRRVNGMLALSRAIGDFGFKRQPNLPWEEQAVTSLPDVIVRTRSDDTDEFFVLACDGIWDVLSNDQVVNFVRPRLQQGMPLKTICDQLMDACLSQGPFGLGCDNMSVIIIVPKKEAASSSGASVATAASAASIGSRTVSSGSSPAMSPLNTSAATATGSVSSSSGSGMSLNNGGNNASKTKLDEKQ